MLSPLKSFVSSSSLEPTALRAVEKEEEEEARLRQRTWQHPGLSSILASGPGVAVSNLGHRERSPFGFFLSEWAEGEHLPP